MERVGVAAVLPPVRPAVRAVLKRAITDPPLLPDVDPHRYVTVDAVQAVAMQIQMTTWSGATTA